jgi:translation initiation factor IF-2
MAVKNSRTQPAEGKTSVRPPVDQTRPPIVAVLGHVDHGKTTLLDKIRQTNVAGGEAGGITQHTGAYQIEFRGKKITFIDTPGHVAFSKMRSRGAKIADLAVLVVAANEGVMPQTTESLKHIIQAKIPYLVAINKTDLPDVNLEWLKKNLAEKEIFIEGYGGQIVAVPVSAKTGKGIAQLLEMILLMGEMAELKGSPTDKLEAVVLESKMDSKRGITATVLVRNGTLKVGEEIMIEGNKNKIKAMLDDKGKTVRVALPGQPVLVLGFSQAPQTGALLGSKRPPKPMAIIDKISETEEKKLKIVLKADMAGTLEAIIGSFSDDILVIHSGVGEINESDVMLAGTTGAQIVGFNIKIPAVIKKLAETEGVAIETYQIIYELLEDLEKKVLKILEPTIDEQVLGTAEIIAEFKIEKQRITGAKVISGVITKQDTIHLKRGETILGDCRIRSMKKGKLDMDKVKEKEEFGAILSPPLDFNKGDMLISFKKSV